MRHIGLGWSFALLPLIYVVALVALACSPTLGVLAVVTTLGRAAEYGIFNPARELLFTVVGREQRYKAKSFIDTVVRRGGDSASGSIYGILRSGDWLGHALPVVSWIVVPFALVWAGLAVLIGIENKRLVKLQSSKTEQP